MQRFIGSLVTPAAQPASTRLLRLLRPFRGSAVDDRPGVRWAAMKPIDFEGEDTSLTQEQLAVLR